MLKTLCFIVSLVVCCSALGDVLEVTTGDPQETTLPAVDSTTHGVPRGVYKVLKRARHLVHSPSSGASSRTPWVGEALGRALDSFSPQGGSEECVRHSILYRNGLDNLTLWAVQMYDASAHGVSGVLSGSAYQLGHFDECVSLQVPALGLSGQYCLPDIQFSPKKVPDFHNPHPEPKYSAPDNHLSVWEKVKNTSDLSHRRRDLLHWAVCVPASCSSETVASALQLALQPAASDLGLHFNVSLYPRRCYARAHEAPLTTGFFVVWGVVIVAATIALTATGMDFFVYQNQVPHNHSIRRWLRPFSMYKNMGKLVTPNPNTEFAEFHLYKLVAIIFVVSGHRQMYAIGQTPLQNVEWVETLNSYFIDVLILNGGVVVDTFFVLSGFLTCHAILQELEKHKRFNFPVVFLNRWIRITPVYMLMVAFYAYVLPHLGDGPLWSQRLHLESTRCQHNWWTNLLFINNYVNSDNQCMVQSWYLACDMHFFVLGSILVYTLWKSPRLGHCLLWVCLAVSMVIPGYITYVNRYYGTVLHYMSLMKDPMSVQHYRDLYIPSHARAGPYLVGIITATIYLKLKTSKFTFSRVQLVSGSLLAGVLLWASILVGWICYDRARPYNVWENTLYGATHRSIWALGLAWFIVAQGISGFGALFQVVKHRLFTPFGRLTYCVFLVHAVPQIYLTATTRLPDILSVPRLFWVVTGDSTVAYILAVYVNLLFEAPLERLQKKIIKRLMTAQKSKLEQTDGSKYVLASAEDPGRETDAAVTRC